MISPQRIAEAKRQGYNAYIATNGHPERTMNPYQWGTAQWKAFNEGWNQARKDVKKKEEVLV